MASTPRTGAYQYQPLPNASGIRLLRVESHGSSYGTLETYTLETVPPFTTLSYTWGCPFSEPNYELENVDDTAAFNGQYTSERDVSILCGDGYVNVTRNAKEALDAVRARYGHHGPEAMFGTTSYIWIDGICINQEDLEERAAQVKIMGQIYAQCERVFIWLGPALAHTRRAIELVDYLAAIDTDQYALMEKYDLRITSTTYEALDMEEIALEDWAVLSSFLQRSWFHRAWVVQEYGLSKYRTVLCGEECVLWSSVFETSRLLNDTRWCRQLDGLHSWIRWRTARERYLLLDSGDDTNDEKERKQAALEQLELSEDISRTWSHTIMPGLGAYALEEMRAVLWPTDSGEIRSLPVAIAMIKGKMASDSRDKVYALLDPINKTLSQRPEIGHITPNYNAENTVARLYADLSFKIIQTEDTLDILQLISDPAFRDIDGLPSWSLDLSRSSDPLPMAQRWPDDGDDLYKGIQPLYKTPSLGVDLTLHVQGIHIGTVSHRAIPYHDLDEVQVIEWLQLARSFEHPYCTGEDPIEVLWRTLISNYASGERPHSSPHGKNFVFFLFMVLASPRTTQERLGLQPFPAERTEHFLTALGHMVALKQEHPACDLLDPQEYDEWIMPIFSDDTDVRRAACGAAFGRGLEFEVHIREWSANRRLFTCGGYVGLGPQSLDVGDELWIIPGTWSPMLLRRMSNGHHVVLGPAYVHGLTAAMVMEQGNEVQEVILE